MQTFWAELYRSDVFRVPVEIERSRNADDELMVLEKDKFGVDEAKELKKKLQFTPLGKGNLLVIVGWKSITIEAEQSLLKILEEPPARVRLVLVVPHDTIFSPTIVSRLKINQTERSDSIDEKLFLEWWGLPIGERLKNLEENLKRKDKVWLSNLKQSLSCYLGKTGNEDGRSKEFMVATELLMRYLNKRGASNKMLLEALALSEPISK